MAENDIKGIRENGSATYDEILLNAVFVSYHGFVNLTDTSLPADLATSTGTLVFTLNKVNNYTVYINGVAILKTSSLTIDLMLQAAWGNGTTDPIGQWYVWFKADGTLGASKTVWSILDTAVTPVATVWVQSTGGSNFEGIVAEERHNYKRNLIEHNNQHSSWGAQYVSGFTGLTIGSGAAGNATNSFSLVGGTQRDEDLFNVISNPQTVCRIGYKDGANAWMKFDAEGSTYVKLSGAEPVYDASGTLTPIPTTSGGRYGIIWQYATNNKATPIVHILGQGFYTSVTNAQAAALPTLYGMTTAEWKLCYRIIVRNIAGALSWIQTNPLYNVSTGPPIIASAISNPSAGNVTYVAGGNIIATNVQSAIEELDAEKQEALTFGIADTNKVQINSASVASGEYAKFTATGLESKSFAEVVTDLGVPTVSGGITAIQQITQAAYTALTPKVSTTLYIIVG